MGTRPMVTPVGRFAPASSLIFLSAASWMLCSFSRLGGGLMGEEFLGFGSCSQWLVIILDRAACAKLWSSAELW